MCELGDTFCLANRSINNHLFFIISDPILGAGVIVTANMTTWRADNDQSCLIQPDEHPFVRHLSCVNYADSRQIALSQYRSFLASGSIIPNAPIDDGLMSRILAGAAISTHLPFGIRQILVDQNLLKDN